VAAPLVLDVPDSLAGERVDKAVALLTGLTRREVDELVVAGGVRVGGKPVSGRARKLAAGDHLEVDVPDRVERGVEPEPDVVVPVVHVDDDVIVVDKPAGLVVHPGSGTTTGTMVAGLLARFPDLAGVGDDPERPGIVHRLDAGTSGLLVVARTDEAHADLVEQLAARDVERRYVALVHGTVEAATGLIDGPLGRDPREPTRRAVVAGGKEARTRYTVLERREQTTVVECRHETGRTHQFRALLAGFGLAVVGEVVYGGASGGGLARPYLHAQRLAFDHPGTGARVAFESELPPELRDADAQGA
jgi:23S rRNA pseudouridine1911/1915/1917 synthase